MFLKMDLFFSITPGKFDSMRANKIHTLYYTLKQYFISSGRLNNENASLFRGGGGKKGFRKYQNSQIGQNEGCIWGLSINFSKSCCKHCRKLNASNVQVRKLGAPY